MPMFPELRTQEVERVTSAVIEWVNGESSLVRAA
jgi:hypothetical protein